MRLPTKNDHEQPMQYMKIISLGMLATLSNPFWYAWWATVASAYLAQAREISLILVAAFYLGHISADYTWNTILSTVIGKGSRWMTQTVYQVIMSLCGLFLIYLGCSFLLKGLLPS
jgi:threonine/homoserine/homoserine lactone efflux protein